MSFTRTILAVGLILAALSGSTARAQEATEMATGEELVAVTDFEATPIEPELIELVPEPIEMAPESVAEPIAEPVAEPVAVVEPIVVPTPVPTLAPTPIPTPSPSPAPVASGRLATTVVDNRFQPNTLSVAIGTTVSWTNNGFNFHTLSSVDGLFDSGALGAGQTFSYTFQKAGEYVLICRQHVLNGMSGRISVQ